MIIIILVIAVVVLGGLYLLKFKKSADHNKMLESKIVEGVDVVTFSGIVGKVRKIITKNEITYVLLETGDGENNCNILIDRDSIFSIINN